MSGIKLYLQVFRRMRPHLWRLAIALAAVALTSAGEVLKPWPLKIVIDDVLRHGVIANALLASLTRPELLMAACGALVVLYVALAILTVTNNYITIAIGQRMVNELRAQMFDRLQRLSLSFHRRREIGDLMVRIAYDTFSLQTIAMNGIFPVVSSLVMLAGMVFVMFKMDVTLTLAAVAVVPMLIVLMIAVSRRIDRLASGARIKESRLYTVAHQALAAIHVVQAFTREEESYREFVQSSSESLSETLKLYIFQTFYAGAVNVMIAVGTAVVIYIGVLHAESGKLTIGDLIVFTTYLASMYAPVNQVFQTYGLIEGAKAGLKRCLELIDIEPEIKDRTNARVLGRASGYIEFDNVVFSYDASRPVLKSISFRAEPGQTIAIVGPSGAGKTTMASLAARFYDPASGTVRIDGIDIRELTLASLRGNIAMVLQPPMVLAGTMRSNIALGRPLAAERQIEQAASMARLGSLIDRLPHGLDEIVGQGGHALSEGEAQRVTIARALLKDAPVLIMDEPTSALDTETESLVLDAIGELMRGRTTLVIAHRLSTIQNADLILVLRDGLIAESGSFAELLSQRGFFSYLYDLQSWGGQKAAGA
ncbi:MAG TPA: ABC transporter ATP-binding protein [Candidatus Binataceae bacterium]|nr:ABC transporter ATP-binding protein [Candidatus Binataceae bacterium]